MQRRCFEGNLGLFERKKMTPLSRVNSTLAGPFDVKAKTSVLFEVSFERRNSKFLAKSP